MSLTLLQIIFLVFAVFAISRVAMKVRSKSIPLVWALVWTGVWIGFAVIVVLPQTTDFLALSLGIGRGVDLVVYLAITALFYATFRILVRIENLEQQLTKLVRSAALKDLDN